MIKEIINNVAVYGTLFTFLALCVSFGALGVAIKALNLKCGNKVAGFYNVQSSVDSSTPYVREILLQNLKDKEVAIHDIYIRFGRNIYLDMLDKSQYDHYVTIIPPLGTILLKFGPAYSYSCGMQSVDMSKLIWGQMRGKIVLSTNQGKISVKRIKRCWSVTGDYFKNYGTQNIHQYKFYTMGSVYRNSELANKAIDFSSYGDRVKFIVSLDLGGKVVEYRVFHAGQQQVAKFENINFSAQILSSEDSLRFFLLEERERGNISFDRIVRIVDLEAIIERHREDLKQYGKYEPKEEGWFEYCVINRVMTIIYNLKEDYKYYKQRKNHWNYQTVIFKLAVSLQSRLRRVH